MAAPDACAKPVAATDVIRRADRTASRPITTDLPRGRKDPWPTTLREAARRSVERAHRYRPRSRMEVLVTRLAPSRGALLRHLHEHHNFDRQSTPTACMTDRQLRAHHEGWLHRFDLQ